MLYHQVHTVPPRPTVFDPTLPPELDELVMSCLAKDPRKRPQNAEALGSGAARAGRRRGAAVPARRPRRSNRRARPVQCVGGSPAADRAIHRARHRHGLGLLLRHPRPTWRRPAAILVGISMVAAVLVVALGHRQQVAVRPVAPPVAAPPSPVVPPSP